VIQIKSPVWERNFYLATVKGRYLPPIVEEFKNFIVENAML
jgi:hypothetical protein